MITNGALITAHITHLRRQHARPQTIHHRRANLERLAAALDPVTLIEATYEDLAKWQDELVRTGRSVATVRCYTSHVRCLYRWAAEHGRRDDDPSRDLRPPKVPLGRAKPIPEDELTWALRAAERAPRTHCWLALAAFCGLRAGEIADLRVEDVTDDGLDVTGKGGKLRTVALPDPIRDLLRPFVAGRRTGQLFPTQYGTRMRSAYVSRTCNEHLAGCGVALPQLHKLRHRFGTQTYRLSRDVLLVQRLLGHGSPATTQIYVAESVEQSRKVVDELAKTLKRGNPRQGPVQERVRDADDLGSAA